MGEIKKHAELAAKIFEMYAKADKVYITSDGQAFLEKSHAKNHANRKKIDVVMHRRPEVVPEDETIEVNQPEVETGTKSKKK